MAVGMGAGSSLRQITVVGSDAREKAGALNFSGDGPGAAGHRNLCVAPSHCLAPRGVASSGLGYVVHALFGPALAGS
jgi:hypothetical protein